MKVLHNKGKNRKATHKPNKGLHGYTKPALIKLGSVTALTTGGSGPLGDITGPTTPGTKQW